MPALTSKQILDLIEKPYTAMQKGTFAHMQRTINGGGSVHGLYGSGAAPTPQLRFVRDWETYPTLERGQQYNHPGARPTQLGTYKTTGVGDGSYTAPTLTQSDLMWLERVPRDPSQVSYEDAQHIASLAHSIPRGIGNNPDARLIHAIWAPIKDFHDRKAAETTILNASRRQAPIPSTAIAAVASAYAAEYDQLTDDECLARADAEVRAAIGRREAQQQRELDDARAVITDIDNRSSSRAEVVRA